MAAVHGLAGAANGPIGPQSLNLLALGWGQILARIETLQERIEPDVVLHVVKKPGVLHFEAGGHGSAVQKCKSSRRA